MNYFMKLMSKLGDFFKSKNKAADNQPLVGKKRNDMAITGTTELDVSEYKTKRDGKLKTFKSNTAKVDKDLEAKERAWINEIIKMAKQEKNGSNS